jgi:nicotinate-nucleotide adenylyltransferase
MKVAILGGSFNPVHKGHLRLAEAAVSQAPYDLVVLVPAFESPFKLSPKTVPLAQDRKLSADLRLKMLLASVKGMRHITVDECELRREGVSWTVDTIDDITERYRPDGKLGLIIGDDLADSFLQWKDVHKIIDNTEIVVARRLGKAAVGYPHRPLENALYEESSHEIRAMIASDADWKNFVPDCAAHII